MRLLAMLSAGFLGFAAAGFVLGRPVEFARRRRPGRETRVARRRRWLRQAGAGVTVAQFYTGSAAAGIGAFAVLQLVTGAWLVSLVPAVLCCLIPQMYFTKRRNERLSAVNRSWPDGLRDLAASVNARLTLHRAIAELARGGPQPLRDAFGAYEANARTMGVVPALELIKEELADAVSDRVIEVLILAKDRGPADLGRILDDLAVSTTADLRTEDEIETARQEPRINMAVAAALPWLILLIMCLGDTPQRHYYASGRGLGPVLVSAAMTFAGVTLVRVLARDPVETRLFTREDPP